MKNFYSEHSLLDLGAQGSDEKQILYFLYIDLTMAIAKMISVSLIGNSKSLEIDYQHAQS